MFRLFQSFCIAMFVLFALSVTSHAQISAHSVDAAGTLGYVHVDGVTSNNHFIFGGSGSYNLDQYVSAGFEYTYTPLGSETVEGINASEHLQTYGGVVRLSFTQGTRAVPYALVGIGGMSEKAVASEGGISASASQSGIYYTFGGGVSVFAGRNWGIRPEFRYERQQFKANTDFASFGQNDVQFTAQIFYQFGGR